MDNIILDNGEGLAKEKVSPPKKPYVKPAMTVVNICTADGYTDEFSMGGQMLTGSVKDKSSGISGVKEESIWDEDDGGMNATSDIWADEW